MEKAILIDHAVLYVSAGVLLKLDMNFDTLLIPPNIAHLKLMQIEQLIEDYYVNKEIISKLISTFEILSAPRDLASIFPFVEEKGSCNTCNSYMVRRFQSRTLFKDMLSEPFCKNCQRSIEAKKIRQKSYECQVIQKENIRLLINLCLNDLVNKPILKINLTSLTDCLYLMALFIRSEEYNETNNIIYQVNDSCHLLPVDDSFLFLHLVTQGIISLDKSTFSTVYEFQNGKVININLLKANWRINLDHSAFTLMLQPEIAVQLLDKKSLENEIKSMWKNIAVEECLEFFLLQSSEMGYPITGINTRKKIRKIVSKFLDKHSSSTCFQAIWEVCQFDGEYHEETGVYNRDFAAINDFTLFQFESRIEYYQSNKITSVGFNRPYKFPRSHLNILFFNHFLNYHRDDAFYKVLTEQIKLKTEEVGKYSDSF